jgi:hypothetical protein
MALDISNVFYLCFRLGPFLVVSYFLFQSVLNWELRGIIYLCGLLLTAGLAYLCNGPVNSLFPPEADYIFAQNAKCNVISLGENGRLLSQIPLSVCVYAYTFSYLLMFLVGNPAAASTSVQLTQSIPTLVLFPALCGLEIFWIVANNCVPQPLFSILAAVLISGAVGVIWAMIVISLKNDNLTYLNDITYCSYVITLPPRTYTVTDNCVELLNLVLSFGICLNSICNESLNDFICLVHHIHICVTIKYNVPYIRVSPKGSSSKGLSPKDVSLKSSR